VLGEISIVIFVISTAARKNIIFQFSILLEKNVKKAIIIYIHITNALSLKG
jgi:hypothetical protein